MRWDFSPPFVIVCFCLLVYFVITKCLKTSCNVQVSPEEKWICAGFQIYNVFDIPLSSWDSDCSIARAIFSHLIGNLWCGSYFQHKQSNYLEQFHFTQQCREVMMNTNEEKSHYVLRVSLCLAVPPPFRHKSACFARTQLSMKPCLRYVSHRCRLFSSCVNLFPFSLHELTVIVNYSPLATPLHAFH